MVIFYVGCPRCSFGLLLQRDAVGFQRDPQQACLRVQVRPLHGGCAILAGKGLVNFMLSGQISLELLAVLDVRLLACQLRTALTAPFFSAPPLSGGLPNLIKARVE